MTVSCVSQAPDCTDFKHTMAAQGNIYHYIDAHVPPHQIKRVYASVYANNKAEVEGVQSAEEMLVGSLATAFWLTSGLELQRLIHMIKISKVYMSMHNEKPQRLQYGPVNRRISGKQAC